MLKSNDSKVRLGEDFDILLSQKFYIFVYTIFSSGTT